MVFYNNFNSQNDYYYQLNEAKRREKNALRTNASKLGALLLIYNLISDIFLDIYYYLVYAYYNHEITLSFNQVLAYLRSNQELINSSLFSMLGNLFVVFSSLVITMIIAITAMNIDFSEMLLPKKTHVKQAVKWFPVCMVINLAASALVAYFTLFMKSAGLTVPETDFTINQASGLTVFLQVLYVIIIGPIAEEMIYRGVILTLLKPFGKWLAVFFSALIFGLMHGNIPQAVSAFAGALVYGLIAVHCNSIIPTILIHMANNAVASYLDFCDVFVWPEVIYYICIIAIILIGVYVFLTRYYQLKIGPEPQGVLTSGQKYCTVFFNVFMIVYFLMILWRFIRLFIAANL